MIQQQQMEIKHIFEQQVANQYKVGNTTAKERIQKLKKFQKVFLSHQLEIQEAVFADFKKHPTEVDISEILCINAEIKHALRHLKSWMKPIKVPPPLMLVGTRSAIIHEPKGVALIISPWNFPFTLTFGPLVSAIAAGNCVILKPSESTPHSSAVIKKIVEESFAANEVSVCLGDKIVAQELLLLPFNHIFYTGGSKVGKIIMAAASKNLTSVTLELGGKSPSIVDETANLKLAAKRIVWGSFINNGQTCIATDYVLVHENVKSKFLDYAQVHLAEMFTENPKESASYCRMVNDEQYARVDNLLKDAVNSGASVRTAGTNEVETRYISPAIIVDPPLDSEIMQEEIFGPLLPVISFTKIEEAIDIIQKKEKPLALYIFSRSKRNQKKILSNTRSGGVVINHSVAHFFHNNLPFGGSNHSGIGKSHGYFGFQAFSNSRSTMSQILPISSIDLIGPPYNNFKKKLINFVIRWL